MINTTVQIWPLAEVRNRALSAGDFITNIKVFNGHLFSGSKTAVVTLDIRKSNDKWPLEQFNTLEKHNGLYTAVIYPTKETIYLDSTVNSGHGFPFSYDFPMNGYGNGTAPGSQYQSMETMQLINKILELEKKVFQLSEDKKRLAEELREFNSVSGKFQNACMGILDQWLLPKLGMNELNFNQNTIPMQGQNQDQQEFNWQSHQVEDLESALMVLVSAFGDDLMIRFAKKIQQNPGLINTLSSMV